MRAVGPRHLVSDSPEHNLFQDSDAWDGEESCGSGLCVRESSVVRSTTDDYMKRQSSQGDISLLVVYIYCLLYTSDAADE